MEFGTQLLIDQLIQDGVVDESRLIQLLGPQRLSVTMPDLETRLVDQLILSDSRLALTKSMVSGYPLAPEGAKANKVLPERVVRSTGAVVLDTPEPTVAFVEPNSQNVDVVSEALRTRDFSIVVITVNQFKVYLREAYRQERLEQVRELDRIYTVFDECTKRRGTDIHVQVGRPPFVRINGTLTPMPYGKVESSWLEREVMQLAGPQGMAIVERESSYDFAFSYGPSRFRINVGKDSHGLTVSARLLAESIPSMDDLALPSAVRNFTELERGLVLVTGPTGSGKSTTLASLLGHISQNQSRHLITLEDPIEYILQAGPNSMVNQREIGQSFNGFPEALRQALRQDPDVILVGEMRDTETARTAVTAAETGHLVFSTLHTYDAQSTVARLVSMYPEGEQDHAREKLAYILKGVVSQTLIPRATSSGRVAAMEIMVSNPAIQNNLRNANGLTHLRSTIQTSRREGMQTMEMALAALVLRGMISQEEAEFRARDNEEFRRYLTRMEDVPGQ